MEYSEFLFFINQMDCRKKARVIVQGSVVFVETASKHDHWSLSTKLLDVNTGILEKQLGTRLMDGSLKWHEKGAHIRIDPITKSVYLTQDVTFLKKYLPFKYLIEDFASIASEWKDVLEECSENSHFMSEFS